MPLLDVRTLIVVFVISNLLVGCLMLAAFRGHREISIRLWIASLFVHALAWLLMHHCGGYRPLFGFLLLSISYALMLTALSRHFKQALSPLWTSLPVTLALLLLIVAPESFLLRQTAGNLIAAAQVGVASYVVLRHRGQRNLLRALMGGSGLISAAILLWRVLDLQQHGASTCLAESVAPVQTLSFLAFFVFRFTFMFGFILLIEAGQRETMMRLATLDSLTEACNRRTFINLAEAELQRSQRHGKPLSLMMLDLDRFKEINDTLGHQAGDAVLIQVKQVADQCLRGSDLFARYGGEEFVVLAAETGADGALNLAERLRAAIEASAAPDAVPVTASIGVVSLAAVSADVTLDQLLARADQAMYQAKAAGRNQVVMAA